MFDINDKMIAIALLKSIAKRPDVSEEIGHHITTAVVLLDEDQRDDMAEHGVTMDQLRHVAMVLTGENFMLVPADPNDPQDVMLHKMMSMVHNIQRPGAAATQQPSLDDLMKDLFGGN